MSDNPKIIYTLTDEAPFLATQSLLPIVQAFAGAAGIAVQTRDISLAGRILSQLLDLARAQSLTGDVSEQVDLCALALRVVSEHAALAYELGQDIALEAPEQALVLSGQSTLLELALVLSIGSGLAAGYILTALFPADALINTWQLTLLDLGWVKSGLSLRINATFAIGLLILLTVFAVQHGGILRSARLTLVLGVTSLIPLLLVGVVPLFTGDAAQANFLPLYPLAHDAAGQVIDGPWDMSGWSLMAGGLFMAAWSTYGFETAVCYTREFKDPKRDTFKAIFYAGLLCILVFTLVPLAFQGSLGLGQLVTPAVLDASGAVVTPAVYSGLLSPAIYSGMGVGQVMADSIGGGKLVANIVLIMLVLATLLAIMTSMSGSSRTLYQASVDGWLPKYLGRTNEHGAPTAAMWTDLSFNLLLLLMSDYVFVLAASNVSYIIFNFLNLNAGWIHRLDRPDWIRPYKAPTVLLAAGGVLSFVNLACMGLGADIWGAGTLVTGLLLALLILPVFCYRHYVQDKGRFPEAMLSDLYIQADAGQKRAGWLPYATLIAGVLVVYGCHQLVA